MVASFWIDEGLLRQWVLKAYHENRDAQGTSRAVLQAIRKFLSGPLRGESILGRYWFEEDPAGSIRELAADLSCVAPGALRRLIDRVEALASQKVQSKGKDSAVNLSAQLHPVAGDLQARAGIGEALACALVAAIFIAVWRLGLETVQVALGDTTDPLKDR